jgi:hypothetical protein
VTNVVLIAPFFGANMVHCLRCFAMLDDVRLGVVTYEEPERIPRDLVGRVAGHYRMKGALEGEPLVASVRSFQKEWGRVDRLEGYLEQLQVPLADARDALGIEGMRGEVARNFRDKNRMKAVLRDAGIPVARQARVAGPEDARSFAASVGYPIVLKPLDGAGAKNTVRVVDDEDLSSALNRLLPSVERPIQAEEFVRGEEHTCESVTIAGETVWSSSTYYLPSPLAVLENPWMQYCLLLPREPQPHVDAFLPTNRKALAALGMENGISHMEWFLRSDGRPVVSEVGARPPGANIMVLNSAAHDVDLWAKWAELQVRRVWDIPERRFAAGCAFLRAQGPGNAVGRVQGLDAVLARYKPMLVDARPPRPGQPRSAHYEGDGWVVVRHAETPKVVEALRALVTEVRIVAGP